MYNMLASYKSCNFNPYQKYPYGWCLARRLHDIMSANRITIIRVKRIICTSSHTSNHSLLNTQRYGILLYCSPVISDILYSMHSCCNGAFSRPYRSKTDNLLRKYWYVVEISWYITFIFYKFHTEANNYTYVLYCKLSLYISVCFTFLFPIN